MGIRVGIDLGTTFSAVAMIDEQTGKPVVVKNSFDSATTPSVLCFKGNGNILFGEDAKIMQGVGDTNTVSFFKRSMGKDMFSVEILGRSYNATDFSAIFLERIKTEAENQIGTKIDAAVITVPAYFTHKEREATIAAGKKAGLDVLAIINEPTAAAFAYGLNKKDTEQTVLIYDLGGGTFDVTIAKINKDEINILGSDGNHELGGKDWDDCIARYLIAKFEEQYSFDLSEDAQMVSSLLVTAENVKKQLTSKDVVNVPIHYKDIKGSVEISAETFEAISQFLIGTTKELTENLIASIGLTWRDIDGVILVGGSTRMRMIHNYVSEMSGKEPLSGVNVDEAVALGAVIRANITEQGKALPTISGLFSKSKSPVVAIQGAKAVSDVIAHSLGMISISQDGEKYINDIIIRKNSKIPASNTKGYSFRTRAKNNELEVYVMQGEFARPLDNLILNKYIITKIEKTSPAISMINVTYQYDSNGVVEVSAVQKETGKTLPVKVEPVPEDMSWTDGSPKDQAGAHSAPNVEVLLTVDLSGSMSGSPLAKAKVAIKKFVDDLDDGFVKIGLIPFANKVNCKVKPTDDYQKVKKAIESLTISDEYGIGNSAHPFTVSYDILKKSDAEIKYVIVLTDGCWSNSPVAITAAKKCHGHGIEVMALGFGSADHAFLKSIASVEEFASLTNLSDLGGSFSKIAQVIGEGTTGIALR